MNKISSRINPINPYSGLFQKYSIIPKYEEVTEEVTNFNYQDGKSTYVVKSYYRNITSSYKLALQEARQREAVIKEREKIKENRNALLSQIRTNRPPLSEDEILRLQKEENGRRDEEMRRRGGKRRTTKRKQSKKKRKTRGKKRQ